MFSHVTLGTHDAPRAVAFFDALLIPFGLTRIGGDGEKGFAGHAREAEAPPQFWIMRPLDRREATVGKGATVAFEASARAEVDALSARALAAGGTDEGAPGLRPHHHPDHHGAYPRDPDGNKLCVVCHRAE